MTILDPRRILFREEDKKDVSDKLLNRAINYMEAFNRTQHSDFEKRITILKAFMVFSEEFPESHQKAIIEELNTILQMVQDDQEDLENQNTNELKL
ncbi:MAG: hypothetical protein K0U37_08495 [Gammaproteobacteria bacterium]|nr:hypothetical protein [Gammaproteobacteria bacterium]